jgi:hypothetical protein
MKRIAYWATTALVSVMLLLSVTYLSGSQEVVSGFNKVGYPQHLRIVLGIAKPLAAIVLLLPGLARLKEWAYAGATFALVMATIANYLAGESTWFMPPILLALLFASYATRPKDRRL